MKKIILSTCIVFAAFTLTTTTATAGVLLKASYGMWSRSDTLGTSPSSEFSYGVLDGTLAFVFPMGLYLGGTYESGALGNNGAAYTGYGPTVGFSSMGFHIDVTYIFSATGTVGTSSSDLVEGTGTVFRLGYAHMFSDMFGIGPSVSMRNITFADIETSGTSLDLEYKISETIPMIDLVFMF